MKAAFADGFKEARQQLPDGVSQNDIKLDLSLSRIKPMVSSLMCFQVLMRGKGQRQAARTKASASSLLDVAVAAHLAARTSCRPPATRPPQPKGLPLAAVRVGG